MNIVTENTPKEDKSLLKVNPELCSFLKNWDENYLNEIKNIDLFNTKLTQNWTKNQIDYFIKMFYHIRGHFHVLLWHLGNFANTKKEKDMILYNISEEFGGNTQSHEHLYFRFAANFGIDLIDEVINEKNNLPFIKKFNRGHLDWFLKHSWEHKMSAFSAYERLDNIDYNNLLSLAKCIGTHNDSLQFFIVHSHADHFNRTIIELNDAWSLNPEIVKTGFSFIANHQIEMWKALSQEVFQDEKK